MITLEEIYQGLALEFQAQTGQSAGGSSELAVRFYAVAAQIFSLYVQAEWTRRQCFPQTAQGEDLDKHAKLRGLTRRKAVQAQGTVRFYVDAARETDTEVPKDTVCMTAAGVRFLTTAVAGEMAYAAGLQREALFSIALVLFVFILLINGALAALLKGR